MPRSPAPFLTATWRNLVLLSCQADPKVLIPYLPRGVELDTWHGQCLITLVGLHFQDIRVLGFPIPFYRSYPQVNLRFYVCRRHEGEWRRGVVFIRQIVPSKLVALVARQAYQEKFVARPVLHQVAALPDGAPGRRVSYQWAGPSGWNHLSVSVAGEPEPSADGSLEEYIAERYYGYNQQRNGSTLEYRLEHPRWRVWPGESAELVCDVAEVYGPELVESLSGSPVSVIVAEGSGVTVHRGVAI